MTLSSLEQRSAEYSKRIPFRVKQNFSALKLKQSLRDALESQSILVSKAHAIRDMIWHLEFRVSRKHRPRKCRLRSVDCVFRDTPGQARKTWLTTRIFKSVLWCRCDVFFVFRKNPKLYLPVIGYSDYFKHNSEYLIRAIFRIGATSGPEYLAFCAELGQTGYY